MLACHMKSDVKATGSVPQLWRCHSVIITVSQYYIFSMLLPVGACGFSIFILVYSDASCMPAKCTYINVNTYIHTPNVTKYCTFNSTWYNLTKSTQGQHSGLTLWEKWHCLHVTTASNIKDVNARHMYWCSVTNTRKYITVQCAK